jgi:hypothetical protein
MSSANAGSKFTVSLDCLFSTRLTAVLYFYLFQHWPSSTSHLITMFQRVMWRSYSSSYSVSAHVGIRHLWVRRAFSLIVLLRSSNAFISGSEISDVVAPSHSLFMWLPGNTGMVSTSVVKYFPVHRDSISNSVSLCIIFKHLLGT